MAAANPLLKIVGSQPVTAHGFLLRELSGEEALSRPYAIRLAMGSEDGAIDTDSLIGQSLTAKLITVALDETRYFNGYIRHIARGEQIFNYWIYHAEIVPGLWFLTRTSDSRIFKDKSAKDIIETVFGEGGHTFGVEWKLDGTPVVRTYCVQYQETDFAFVSRLLEEEGWYYYFRHADGSHQMVISDATRGYDQPRTAPLVYDPREPSPNGLTRWELGSEFRSGKWAHSDFDFKKPSTNLTRTTTTTQAVGSNSGYEVFEFPGRYYEAARGDALVRLRMEEEETARRQATGETQNRLLQPGGKFTQKSELSDSATSTDYLVLSVRHEAHDYSEIRSGDDGGDGYSNTFTCTTVGVVRPPRVTPKPVIHGLQTAIVIGPDPDSTDEIYTDEAGFGRVKVRFPWDRKKDSAVWARVAQLMAGSGWGAQFLPRVGHEVVISFIDGDPDRPLVIGSVYNAENMPPYALPANKTQSGFKSRSTLEGATTNFNELRFEDKKGSEEVYFHAEKDFNRVVENNDTLTVGSDDSETCADGSQTTTIYKDRTTTIKTGNEVLTVEKGNRTVTVSEGDDTHTVTQGKRTVTVQADDMHQVKQGKRTVTVDTGDDAHQVKMGNRDVKIDMGNDTLTISMGNQTTKLSLGKSSTEAMQSIELKVGQSSVKIDQMGVTIEGMMIKINGQLQTEVQGLMTKLSGSAMTQISGGITMIG